MRFTEIANPEDQLALWKLVSDKVWATFQQQASHQPSPVTGQKLSIPASKSVAKPLGKSNVKPIKPKKVPILPTPKPLSKPQPQQLQPTLAVKQQSQQNKKVVQHMGKEINKSIPQQKIYPQPPTAIQNAVSPKVRRANDYDEREKEELVMHSLAQNPFKTVAQTKNAFTGQKRGI